MLKSRHTFIIAEAGVNHNGDIGTALKLVDAAKEAGADAVKFQTFKAENLVTHQAPKADYQKAATGDGSQFAMLKALELSFDDHVRLKRYCDEKNILFLSTPFDFESVDLLEKIGVEYYKTSSGDLTNIPLIEHIAKKNKPMIVSTGMANLGEVEMAVEAVRRNTDQDLWLLHCTSNYPAAMEDVNLNAMLTMKHAFKVPVGYSDHTKGIEIPAAAVALGAEIIEKHLTLDKTMKGPDHKASLEPAELKKMVESIRNVEMSLGDGVKRCNKSEANTRMVARKSIVARRDLKKGEKLTLTNLDFKRPESGISPIYIHLIVNRKIVKDIKQNDLITLDLIE
ncbi:N-acetylneuraminate synthase [Sporolactobacillus sp. CQH2019]|uniref:N-acetylneuraminate synthase n=1 Tax=Sporolactobacillus sp. CQH2019 TaxID=3023512 RepID=UPI0023676523|nr:N-acetylneuraminate synthase [Sporolactobacillus sp. CQH2019]MDD9148063.1 N-acetylneuraminate synthase [Sporolactobacillus sp. CQH2019]